MKNILFVCTGNTCRSSMSKGIFDTALARNALLMKEFTADSAGLAVTVDAPASANSIQVLKNQWDIDISTHRAKSVTEHLVRKADLILTMTRGHKDAVLLQFPWLLSRVFTLKEYSLDWEEAKNVAAYNDVDILDPYGMPISVYTKCAREIASAIDMLVVKLGKSFATTP